MRLTSLCFSISTAVLACGGTVEPGNSAAGSGGAGGDINGDPGPASGSATATAAGTGGGGGFPLFFVTIAAKLAPKKPFVILAARILDPDTGSFRLQLQPVAAADRVTLVGESIQVGPFDEGPDGSFTAALPSIVLPAAANPINMSDIELTATLTTEIGFPAPCGDVTGQVTKPVALDLQGSTFTMAKVTTSATYPEPPQINCAGDLAVPVGDL